jgi:hypothetical protein
MSYYIPDKDEDLVTWSANFTKVVFDNLPRFGVTEAEYTALSAANSAFASAVIKAYSPAGSPQVIAEKNTARETLEERIRGLVNFKLQNPVITDDDRHALGINKRNQGGGGPHTPVAKKSPGVKVDTSTMCEISIHFYDIDSLMKRGKAFGQHCVEIVSRVGGSRPERYEDFTHSNVDTRSPFVFKFEYNQRGEPFYFAIRWENTRGEKGPWSEIFMVIIP